MMARSDTPDKAGAYLNSIEAIAYLRTLGIKMGRRTLRNYCHDGGGPVFHYFENQRLYTREALAQWVAARMSPPQHRTTPHMATGEWWVKPGAATLASTGAAVAAAVTGGAPVPRGGRRAA